MQLKYLHAARESRPELPGNYMYMEIREHNIYSWFYVDEFTYELNSSKLAELNCVLTNCTNLRFSGDIEKIVVARFDHEGQSVVLCFPFLHLLLLYGE